MKFSYSIIKKFVPALKSPEHLADTLTMHLFEVEGIDGDTLDVKVLANRYADAASHAGIARVVAAALNTKLKTNKAQPKNGIAQKTSTLFGVDVKEKTLCSRYGARYFIMPKFYLSPPWLKQALAACGIKPINAVVDIMNYVMLETGEPMHAFDADKMYRSASDGKAGKPEIIIRCAKKGETIETLDGNSFELAARDLVIADHKGALAIAGIKGGKRAEITASTTKIIVEAATFDQTAIYKTSRRLKLQTDASLRFSHGMPTVLVPRAMTRATELLREICHATPSDWIDIENAKPQKVVLKFDIARANQLTGLSLSESEAFKYLERLGFEVKGKLVTVPEDRTDIRIFEDLVEEIVALYGVNKIAPIKPVVPLAPPKESPLLHMRERIYRILPGFGFSEVMNYSFARRGIVEVENPIADDKRYLRESLAEGLLQNIESNLRFSDAVRVFELGHVFSNDGEREVLGIGIGSRKNAHILELKGVLEALLDRLGIHEALIVPLSNSVLRVETGSHEDIVIIRLFKKGADATGSIAELDLESLVRVVEEKEFKPIPKYPAVVRDISVVVKKSIKTGDLLESIEHASGWLKDGVQVVDFFEGARIGEGNQAMTFRLPFRSNERTLTEKEVEQEFKKIIAILRDNFEARIR